MSKTTSGVKPTAGKASITGKARQTGSASKQAGGKASKTGSATRVRKPLTPEQRKRKQERDRKYRLVHRKGTPQVPGAVSVPSCVCGSSAESSSDARKWLNETLSSLEPGECKTKTFTGGGRQIHVSVGCGTPGVRGVFPSGMVRPHAPGAVANVFDGIVNELLDGMFRGPVHCGMDLASGPMQVVRWLVPREQALRWQVVSDVRAIVDSRIGWLHDPAEWEEMA